MAARGSGGSSIGGVAMFAHRQSIPDKIAPAATPHLAQMTGNGVAAAPIAPEATVSGGKKNHHHHG